ncbi:hypothetical protein DFP73DRAFT_549014 [Morchella snyderi]|nr:hypothetical protein DFP73DRAFT_549014 [Morchella snyderi]
MLSVQMQDINRIPHFGDAPRPDSITLPMQTTLRPNPPDTLPANTAAAAAAAAGRPLGTMLNRFHSPSNSASHRRLGSGDSRYSSRVTTSAWDNDRPTRAVSSANILPTASLCGPSSGTYQGVSMSSQPSTPGPVSPVPFSAYRSPSITSLESNPPRIPARGKRPFRDTIMSVPRPRLMSKKLRKKIQPITENKAISEPALGAAPMAGSAGFWRASGGSMSNWVSWWESSSDEEEEVEATTKRKRRKK